MTININGKDYDETTFNDTLKNYLIARQEVQNNRIRLIMEIEKCNVLLDYYNGKINEELKKIEQPEQNNKE
jgi:hypothetical protein